mgnify:CR=1 FL=1
MVLAVLTATFKSTFSSSKDSIHITDREVPSLTKRDVWQYCVELLGIDTSTMDIQYSPDCKEH